MCRGHPAQPAEVIVASDSDPEDRRCTIAVVQTDNVLTEAGEVFPVERVVLDGLRSAGSG